jgi:hypothetical protein
MIIGRGSHELRFSHPEVGDLTVLTGADRIAWGYVLNTANFPTYGGEVVQILSCYVDNIEIEGTLQTYEDMESLYRYFLGYLQTATQGKNDKAVAGRSSFNEHPMKLEYPHRGWTFEIIPLNVPGYRKGREVVAPTWRLEAHVVDRGEDVEDLKDLIISEAEIRTAVGSDDPNFDQNFGLEGKIKFVDENPFSDPFTDSGQKFDPTKNIQAIGDYYSKLLPSYLQGDFDSIFGGIGSKPAFNSKIGAKGTNDEDGAVSDAAKTVAKKVTNTRGG